MPNLFQIKGYYIYFWSNENNEPIHVHISKGSPMQNSTKVWLTSKGGCVVANNNSHISQKDLNDLLEAIQAQFFYICGKWQQFFAVTTVKFYC
ncbi:MAG: DUF4160 domain-containing protein [Treponema sp.]